MCPNIIVTKKKNKERKKCLRWCAVYALFIVHLCLRSKLKEIEENTNSCISGAHTERAYTILLFSSSSSSFVYLIALSKAIHINTTDTFTSIAF